MHGALLHRSFQKDNVLTGLHSWSLLGSNAGALKAEAAVEEKDPGVRCQTFVQALALTIPTPPSCPWCCHGDLPSLHHEQLHVSFGPLRKLGAWPLVVIEYRDQTVYGVNSYKC